MAALWFAYPKTCRIKARKSSLHIAPRWNSGQQLWPLNLYNVACNLIALERDLSIERTSVVFLRPKLAQEICWEGRDSRVGRRCFGAGRPCFECNEGMLRWPPDGTKDGRPHGRLVMSRKSGAVAAALKDALRSVILQLPLRRVSRIPKLRSRTGKVSEERQAPLNIL